MTDPTSIVPSSGGSGLLKVHGTSKLAFGATTAALVTLASGGTALLVAHGTGTVSSPTSIPGGLLTDTGSQAGDVIVDRAPGTFAPDADAAERALREALARRAPTGRRILTVPLVHLGGTPSVDLPGVPSVPVGTPPRATLPGVTLPGVTPPVIITPPVVVPPVLTPPVLTPPVVVPPVHVPRVPPPVIGPPTPPTTEPTVPPGADNGDNHKDDNGNKHRGKDRQNDKRDGDRSSTGDNLRAGDGDDNQVVIDLRDDESGKPKHARSGRHAR